MARLEIEHLRCDHRVRKLIDIWFDLDTGTFLDFVRLARHTTRGPKSCEVLPLAIGDIFITDVCCRFEIHQDHTAILDQHISMVAILMEEPKSVELLQDTLALLVVPRSRTSGAFGLLQHKSDLSVTFGHKGQELWPNTLAEYFLVNVTL